MKKYLLSVAVLALASMSVFTSCKDDDEIAVPADVTVTVDKAALKTAEADAAKNAAAEALTAAKATAPADATVTQDPQTGNITIKNADNTYTVTTTETSYTYEIDGVTYNTMEAVQAELAKRPAGSTATVVAVLHQTTTTQQYNADGTKNGPATTNEKTTKGKETEIEIPGLDEAPKTAAVILPTSVTDATQTKTVDVTVKTTEKGQHSGGSIN